MLILTKLLSRLQPRAFSIMPLVYNIGRCVHILISFRDTSLICISVLGPAFGGALSNPLHRRPGEASRSAGWILWNFPYALPNVVAACFFLVGITVGTLFLKETLASQKNKPDYGLILGLKLKDALKKGSARLKHTLRSWNGGEEEEEEPLLQASTPSYATAAKDEEHAIDHPDAEEDDEKRPTYTEVLTKQTSLNLLVYTLLAMHSIAFDQLLPVFMHHSRHGRDIIEDKLPFSFNKGFGIDSGRIGLMFTLYGAVGIFYQFVVFPPLARHYGVLNCLRIVLSVMPVVYLLAPFSTLVPSVLGAEITLFCLWLIKGLCSTFAFPCSTILLTNSAPSLRVLGTINGIATSVSAIGRAAGPTYAGSLFTWGTKEGFILAPFWGLSLVAALSTIPTWWLVEGDGFGHDDDEEDEEEEEILQEDGDERRSSAYKSLPTSRDEAEHESEIVDDLGPLLNREGTLSRTISRQRSHRNSLASSVLTETDSEFDGQDDGEWIGPSAQEQLSRSYSRGEGNRRGSLRRRRSSVPVGMGPGFRRMSSNLGQTRSGFGNGGGIADG
jgi:MFS family permease